ncbi:hypothetical protein VCV18_005943 [Metarhizium anisopliae]
MSPALGRSFQTGPDSSPSSVVADLHEPPTWNLAGGSPPMLPAARALISWALASSNVGIGSHVSHHGKHANVDWKTPTASH